MSTQAAAFSAPYLPSGPPSRTRTVANGPRTAAMSQGDSSGMDSFSSSAPPETKPSQAGLFNLFGQKAIALYQWVTRETPVKYLWKNIHCLHREKDGELSCSTFGMEAFKHLPWYKAAFYTLMRVGTCAPLLHDSRLARRFGDQVLETSNNESV